jgi:hypothetical protein
MDLPEPGGPQKSRLWPPAGGDLERALGVLLALDVAEVGDGGAFQHGAGPWAG